MGRGRRVQVLLFGNWGGSVGLAAAAAPLVLLRRRRMLPVESILLTTITATLPSLSLLLHSAFRCRVWAVPGAWSFQIRKCDGF